MNDTEAYKSWLTHTHKLAHRENTSKLQKKMKIKDMLCASSDNFNEK